MHLPYWDSLEGTSQIHNVFELSAIVLFFVVVVFELLAYAYGHRHERLNEQQQAPRHLTDIQKAEIVNAISLFKNQHVRITSNPGNDESDDFAREFFDVITQAHWAYTGTPGNFETIFSAWPIGVEVTLNKEDVQARKVPVATANAYNALIGVLHKIGIVNDKEPAFVSDSVPKDTIEIRVGAKPEKPGRTSADRHPKDIIPFGDAR